MKMSNLFGTTDKKIVGVFLRAMGLVAMGLSSRKISIGSPVWSNVFAGGVVAKNVVASLYDAVKQDGPEKLGEISMLIDVPVWERLMGPLEAEEKELVKKNPIWGSESRAKLARLRGDLLTSIDALKEDVPTQEVIDALELAVQTSAAPTEDWDRVEFCIEAFKCLTQEERARVVATVYEVPTDGS